MQTKNFIHSYCKKTISLMLITALTLLLTNTQISKIKPANAQSFPEIQLTEIESQNYFVITTSDNNYIIGSTNQLGWKQWNTKIQKIDSETGEKLWGEGEIDINNGQLLQILPDDNGGAYLIWTNSSDLFVYRVNSDGEGYTNWDTNEIPGLNISNFQNNKIYQKNPISSLINSNGDIVIASEFLDETNYDGFINIYLIDKNTGNIKQGDWPIEINISKSVQSMNANLELIDNEENGFYIAYMNLNYSSVFGNYSIIVEQYDSSGNPIFSQDVEIKNTEYRAEFKTTKDNNEGVYIAQIENEILYITQINKNGTKTINKRPLWGCPTIFMDSLNLIITENNDLYITWIDNLNPDEYENLSEENNDIYASGVKLMKFKDNSIDFIRNINNYASFVYKYISLDNYPELKKFYNMAESNLGGIILTYINHHTENIETVEVTPSGGIVKHINGEQTAEYANLLPRISKNDDTIILTWLGGTENYKTHIYSTIISSLSLDTILIENISPRGLTEVGGEITIIGSNLEEVTQVKIENVNCENLTFDSETPDNKLTCITPPHSAGEFEVIAYTNSEESFPYSLTYYGQPIITSISPYSGTKNGGYIATIKGSGFGPQTTVKFDNTEATVLSSSWTELQAIVPEEEINKEVTILLTNPGGKTATTTFFYTPSDLILPEINTSWGYLITTVYDGNYVVGFNDPPYVQKINAETNTLMWTENEDLIDEMSAFSVKRVYQIVPDQNGGAYILWIGSKYPNKGLYLTHILNDGSLDENYYNNDKFSKKITNEENNGDDYLYRPTMISDHNNNLFINLIRENYNPSTYKSTMYTELHYINSETGEQMNGDWPKEMQIPRIYELYQGLVLNNEGGVYLVMYDMDKKLILRSFDNYGSQSVGFENPIQITNTEYAKYKAIEDEDGGIIITINEFDSVNNIEQLRIVALDDEGSEYFSKNILGSGDQICFVDEIIKTEDGSIFLVCSTVMGYESIHNYLYLIKINPDGDIQYNKFLGVSIDDAPGITTGGNSIAGKNTDQDIIIAFGNKAKEYSTKLTVLQIGKDDSISKYTFQGLKAPKITINGNKGGMIWNGGWDGDSENLIVNTFVLSDISPTISSINPDSGSVDGGTLVTIYGEHFQKGVEIKFGEKICENVEYINHTTVKCETPKNETAGPTNVTVTNTDNTTNTKQNAFTYTMEDLPAYIISITPESGNIDGDTNVIIKGENFKEEATVTFGEKEAPYSIVIDSETILAQTPENEEATYTVSVKNPNSTNAILEDAYTYDESPNPEYTVTITSVEPENGSTKGNEEVTITGTGFDETTEVYFDSKKSTITEIESSTSIKTTTPSNHSGNVDIIVTVSNDGDLSEWNVLEKGFKYEGSGCNDLNPDQQCGVLEITGTTDIFFEGYDPEGGGSIPSATFKQISSSATDKTTTLDLTSGGWTADQFIGILDLEEGNEWSLQITGPTTFETSGGEKEFIPTTLKVATSAHEFGVNPLVVSDINSNSFSFTTHSSSDTENQNLLYWINSGSGYTHLEGDIEAPLNVASNANWNSESTFDKNIDGQQTEDLLVNAQDDGEVGIFGIGVNFLLGVPGNTTSGSYIGTITYTLL